jgi:hypothetical protein
MNAAINMGSVGDSTKAGMNRNATIEMIKRAAGHHRIAFGRLPEISPFNFVDSLEAD